MRAILLLNNLFLLISLLQSPGGSSRPETQNQPARPPFAEAGASLPAMTVSLRAATGATIRFRSEKGNQVSAPGADDREIPHLVLTRNGVLTPNFERTLHISLGNVSVPPAGLYARLALETHHGDPDRGGKYLQRIQTWEETRFLPYFPDRKDPRSLNFTVVFQDTFVYNKRTTRTPTDYYNYQLTVFDTKGNVIQETGDSYAFLLENQWQVPLPAVLEDTPDAAPQKLVVYFYDMLPFQADVRDAESRLPRSQVARYIQTELIPRMVEAFVVQTNVWGFPWYAEWTNARRDEEPKSLSVALGQQGTWFHGEAPSLGHAMISIRVDGSFGEYDNMTDGILSVFQHELFHNQQRNLSLHFGSQGNLLGKDFAWELFSEGTAVLASLVGQPRVQFGADSQDRSYLRRANSFLGSQDMVNDALNQSYRSVPYQTAIYWRFLYEKCGGLRNGSEDPAAGMQVIRNILVTLYAGEIADINASANVIASLPHILDRALQATPSCPFHTHQESLLQFTRAIYQLRLADGRCSSKSDPLTCGLYDPGRLYSSPHADQLAVTSGFTSLDGSIPSSFGVDLIELTVDPAMYGKALKIVLQASASPQDEFHVELHALRMVTHALGIKRSSFQTGRVIAGRTHNGYLLLEIPSLDEDSLDQFGVIVTRLDPHEESGSQGKYVLQLIVE